MTAAHGQMFNVDGCGFKVLSVGERAVSLVRGNERSLYFFVRFFRALCSPKAADKFISWPHTPFRRNGGSEGGRLRFVCSHRAQISSGGAEMRVKITLACTECKQRNYNTKKNKKNDPDRLEMNKYCKFCKKHTLHKETK